MSAVQREVYLCNSARAAVACDRLPSNLGRSSMVDSLISAFGLDSKCHVISVTPAAAKDLCTFHDERYVAEILKLRTAENEENHETLKEAGKSESMYGLAFDCPPFAGLADYVQYTAGSSLGAANTLITRAKTQKLPNGDSSKGADEPANIRFPQNVAVNWYGGRHHGSKSRASGFCYVNDIVLAILKLRTRFKKVFYFDADLHHGDGVESAFRYSKYVQTFSVHRHDVGFFPGTGANSEKGAFNVPTKRGLGDSGFDRICSELVEPQISKFEPDIIVLQCGCDGLATDPNGEWNLTIKGLASALSKLIDSFENTHFLVLGGGGYNHAETARFCAYLTKLIVQDEEVWVEIPEHPHIEEYERDGFRFWTSSNVDAKPGRRDENGDIVERFRGILDL